MDGKIKNEYQLKPLTKTSRETGEIYYRREEVTAQILAVFNVNEKELIDKFSELKSETLVFLLRERFNTDFEVSSKIWEVLSENIWKIALGQKSKFSDSDFEDLVSEIQLKLFENISNPESNDADYAQVSFGEYVKGIIINKLRQKRIVLEREKNTFWLDDESEKEERIPVQLIAKMTNVEKSLVFQHALKQLPREILGVCCLHYLEGIQIDSKDRNKITLTKIFQKSDKTIRTWLCKAEEILSEYQGELR